MTRHKATGTFTVTGIGQSILDLKGLKIPISGEIRVAGMSRQATISVFVPNELVYHLSKAIDKPVEQIPLYRPELIRLSLQKA